MTAPLSVRRMRPGEAQRLYAILRASVLKGTAETYSDGQRRAWAPERPPPSWAARLSGEQIFVAELEGRAVGFMGLEDGHLDLAYVLPDAMRQGIGTHLLRRAMAEASLSGLAEMTCDASEIARPFLERHGWQVVRRETVARNGEQFVRYRMRVDLSAS